MSSRAGRRSTLRIGADGSWMRWPGGGISRYMDGLLHAMEPATRPDEELVVYYNSTRGKPMFGPGVRERFIRLPNRTAWNQLRVPVALQRDGIDVYLAGGIVVPMGARMPVVPVIYDCLSFRDPTAKSRADIRYWRRWTLHAAHRASRIVAISEFVADDCVRFLGAERSRIDVAYPGVDARFTPGDEADAADRAARLARMGVADPFVLHVGAFDPHKGGRVAVDAVGALVALGRQLTLVRIGPDKDTLASPPPFVKGLGRVDDATLVDLYRAAEAVIVTSTHEGFGLPTVEAMACGSRVVSTRAGALPEAGGDVALYAEAGDAASFAAALQRLFDASPDERVRLRNAGFAHAATFTWARAADRILGAIRAAAHGERTRASDPGRRG